MGPNTGNINAGNPWGAVTSSYPYRLPTTYPTTAGNVLLVLAYTTYTPAPGTIPPITVTDSAGDSFGSVASSLDSTNAVVVVDAA